MLPKTNYKNQSGQALIIILLAMSVVLTLVLSSVSRSVTDIRITTEEEESLRAFSAAEAGVEKALLELTSTGGFDSDSGTLDGQTNTSYNVVAEDIPAGSYYEYPNGLMSGETATFWLVGQDANGNLNCDNNACAKPVRTRICFGDENSPHNNQYTPAIEIQAYYDNAPNAANPPISITSGDYTTIKVDNKALDGYGARANSNNFISAGACPIAELSSKYEFGYTFDQNTIGDCLPSRTCVLMLKVKMHYANQPTPVVIGLNEGPSPVLPAQGVIINSTGVSGESSRRLKVNYNTASMPEIFNNILFSASGITK